MPGVFQECCSLVLVVMQSQIEALEPKMERSAPTLESGLFAHKRGKPIPIAVGHTTALDVHHWTQAMPKHVPHQQWLHLVQLW